MRLKRQLQRETEREGDNYIKGDTVVIKLMKREGEGKWARVHSQERKRKRHAVLAKEAADKSEDRLFSSNLILALYLAG